MKEIIATDKAPRALGAYSQAVKVTSGNLLFTSGQIALDPGTGELVGKDAREQTGRVMENLKGILEAAGTDFSKVVKATIYLAEIADFAAVNEVYAGYIPENPPARATVAVKELPKQALIEIDLVAIVD